MVSVANRLSTIKVAGEGGSVKYLLQAFVISCAREGGERRPAGPGGDSRAPRQAQVPRSTGKIEPRTFTGRSLSLQTANIPQ